MTPLVLLPGMMCDARLFGPQITALGLDRAIHVAPMNNHDTIAALACEILENAPPRFALAGLSMGGIVAMEVLRLAGDRVTRLALLDTNPKAELGTVKAQREPQMNSVRSGRLQEVMRDEMKPNYLVDSQSKPEIMGLCMEMALAIGPEVFLRQSAALRDRHDQQDTLRAYKGPSLVLCGRHDALCPVKQHELMHDLLANSRLEIIENAGHLPTLEQPEITTAALARWLEE